MVADEFYDGKPWVDLSEELLQRLKRFAGVDMQQTSDEDFCRQTFRVLKTDASVPVDSRVFMHKRALSTGNHETPCDMLRQGLHVRFGLHRIYARITTSTRL